MSDTHIHIHINHTPVSPPWKINPVTRPKSEESGIGRTEREQIHKLVRCIVARDEADYRSVFRSLYDEYERRHNQHPIIESFRAGMHSHLDWVSIQPEGLARLLAIAEAQMSTFKKQATAGPPTRGR
jgi:hypothetical protein